MYYILDDKIERQKALASDFILKSAHQKVQHIHRVSELKQENFWNGVQGLFLHDSFFRNKENYIQGRPSDHLRRDLENECAKRSLLLVVFSGDFSTRAVQGNKAQLPVEAFYRNIDGFIKEETNNLKVLAFGKNYRSEEKNLLLHKIKLKLFAHDKSEVIGLDLLASFPELQAYLNLANESNAYQEFIGQAREKQLTKEQIIQKLKEC